MKKRDNKLCYFKNKTYICSKIFYFNTNYREFICHTDDTDGHR